MAAQPPLGPSSTPWARLAVALAALGPPTLVGAGLWPDVQTHPVLSGLALLGYWIALAVVEFLRQVGKAVQDKWVQRVADLVDATVTDRLARTRRTYLKHLAASIRYIDVRGLTTIGEYALELRQVYVDVSLVPRAVHETLREPLTGTVKAEPPREPLTGTVAAETSREPLARTVTADQRRSLQSFLDADRAGVFAVIGAPGSGKTTLLRRTTLDLCRSRRGDLPILLYLRDHIQAVLDDPDVTLGAIAAGQPWLKGRIPATWFERCLQKGRCRVMLDGLDEVAKEEDRKAVVRWMSQQTIRYSGNTFVVTSRPHGYHDNPLNDATVLQVRRFTPEQIASFLHGWYHAIEQRSTGETGPETRARARNHADDLLERLRRKPALYDLAANPLLLTMIANVHRYRGALPGSRAGLYGEMCEVLLHRRQESKGLADHGTALRGEQKERVVRELALTMMLRGVKDISVEGARKAIGPALARVSRDVTPEAFLAETEKSGLIVERESGILAFAHLTLQEYLAATEIKQEKQPSFLAKRVDDPAWRETTLLWSATADASPVVESCLTSGTVRALALAFDCADEARELSPDLRDRLESLLSSPTSEGPDADGHRRLITAIKINRALRDVIHMEEGTALCAHPVTSDLYRLFTENAAGSHYPPEHITANDWPSTETPITGLWPNDVTRFVDWLNFFSADASAYRLPTTAELSDPAINLVVDLTRSRPWAGDGRDITLHGTSFLSHDFRRVTEMPLFDYDQIRPYLLNATVLALIGTAKDARVARLSRLDNKLAAHLSPALTYARGASDIARHVLLERELVHLVARNRFQDMGLELRLAAIRARMLDDDMTLAKDPRIDRIRRIGELLDIEATRPPDESIEIIDRAYAEVLEDVEELVDENCPLLALTDNVTEGRIVRDYRRLLGAAHELASNIVIHGEPASERGGHDGAEHRLLLLASATLCLVWWLGNSPNRPPALKWVPKNIDDLPAAIAEFMPEYSEMRVVPGDLTKFFRSTYGHVLDKVGDRSGNALWPIASALVTDIVAVLEPILERRAPYDRHRVRAARIAALAVAVLAEVDTQRTDDDAIIELILMAHILSLLECRASGSITPPDVLLLVRG
ncbi:NACHT domain-containing protein [Sphaerisporangium sp. NPDC051017]|uniref:NACHT domain-containing protein n=1 Tax=Sphaerisporangium sp. NPDC051017 TaxID=3154636 RepID=UPI0034245D4A